MTRPYTDHLLSGPAQLASPCFSNTWELPSGSGEAMARLERLGRSPRPRSWRFDIGGSAIAELSGSLVSHNRVDGNAMLALPSPALMLAWHVVARPSEAAAAPSGLIPAPGAGRQDRRR